MEVDANVGIALTFARSIFTKKIFESMEDLEQIPDATQPEPENPAALLRITPEIRAYWIEIANWALVFAGLTTLYFIVSSINSLSNTSNFGEADLPKSVAFGAVIIGGVITLIPVWFLFKFATLTKDALRTESNQKLEEGFGFLKYHYVFYGILAILYFGLIVLAFVMLLVVSSSRGGF